MSRDYTIGAADADTGVAADATAPNAGAVVKVPDYTDVMDGPKAFVEFANSMPEGGGGVTVSDTEPASPDVGDQWFKSDTGKLYVYYGTDWIESSVASGLPYSFGTATPTTTDNGFIWYDSNSTPPAPKFWDGAAFQALGGGKILQIVRATNATESTTTSSSFVDITGLSVTITPKKSDSAILLILAVQVRNDASGGGTSVQITDASNTTISGAVETIFNTGGDTSQGFITCMAYSTPATTSATTYKGRFRRQAGTGNAIIRNNQNPGQIYAIEVSA